MGQTTEISWCDHTFNPWHGCVKVSPACDHCYAETFARRVGFSETGSKFPIWGKDAQRRFFGDKHWQEPLKWNRDAEKAGVRARVFCGSMCDVMEDYNGTGYLARETVAECREWLYRLIEKTPHLDWLLLTKRPQNFRRFLPRTWLERPRPNVWGMTTVESADYLWRIDALKGCPFVVHGLSIEPLLEDMPTLGEYLDGIGWVIAGGESGPGARPMHPDWARRIRGFCEALEIPFHFKQWGEYRPLGCADMESDDWDAPMVMDANEAKTFRVALGGEVDDGNTEPLPRQVGAWMMERVGKKKAGRLLDGREWNEVPEVALAEVQG